MESVSSGGALQGIRTTFCNGNEVFIPIDWNCCQRPHSNPAIGRKLPMTNENGKVILHVIHAGWVQRVMERYNIVSRRKCGKLMISPAKQIIIEKQVAFHLGTVCHDFESRRLDEEFVENIDDTHFVVNVDNGRTFGFAGAQEVKYANFISGVHGMTFCFG